MHGVRLRRWTDVDLELLRAANTPEMNRFLGGPEPDAAIPRRHERYLRGWDTDGPRMFAVVDDRGVGLGSIGWWQSEFHGPVHEVGWAVLPHAQGRGVASAALRLLLEERAQTGSELPVMACPPVENLASNALCESAGFTLEETSPAEFRGSTFTLNWWVLR
jgi:RimJ/RimL family protein N-acetyltransferase